MSDATTAAVTGPAAAGQPSAIPEIESDKAYWHRYVETYENAFANLGRVTSILEFGVAWGGSIRWLAERFPEASIVGADITPLRPEWPIMDRIRYLQLDQGDRAGVAAALASLGVTFDLIIEDGSHFPKHQAICLTEALPWLRSGGLYILEDIHSSHREHQLFREHQTGALAAMPNALNLLLGLQHIRERGLQLNDDLIGRLASPEFSAGRRWWRCMAPLPVPPCTSGPSFH